MEKKLGWRNWLSFLLVGLVGQLAWAIENNQINLWVYSQTQDTSFITWMTYASAIAATLTTFLMGALSDRLGKRKIFIVSGYILWGISVFAFGLMSLQNLKEARIVGIMMIVIDCIMTFFGSTANDACFNAYVTDRTNEKNRGKVESVLSVLPLFANVLMLVGLMITGASQYAANIKAEDFANRADYIAANANAVAPKWFIFFLIFGVMVMLVGIASIWLLPKDDIHPNRKENYMKSLIYGFRPSTVKKNPNFYIALIAFMAFNCAIDAFLPYYMVYFQNPVNQGGLGYGGDNIMTFYIAVGIILLLASVLTIVVGAHMDRIGKKKLLLPAIGLSIVGFIGMFFFKIPGGVIPFGVIMMFGYLVGTASLGAIIRDQTPTEEVGLFQGVRMVFVVLLPMVIGPMVSQAFFDASSFVYDDGMGKMISAPSRVMFLVAMGFMVVAIAPALWLILRKPKKTMEEPKQEEIDE